MKALFLIGQGFFVEKLIGCPNRKDNSNQYRL